MPRGSWDYSLAFERFMGLPIYPSLDSGRRAHAVSSLEVHLLGLVEFDALLALQERLIYDISGRTDTQAALLLCEHPPIISIGREGSRSQVLAEPHDIEACEIEARWVSRGGGAFIHAPGQLAVYPIVPLDRLECGICRFRDLVEESLLSICREQQISAKRAANAPGIWCREGQVASFGAAVKNWTTCFGAYLNVSLDPSFLRMVDSWPSGERLTSLESLVQRPVAMHSIREAAVHHLSAGLRCDRVHVYTGHPLLTRTHRAICLHA